MLKAKMMKYQLRKNTEDLLEMIDEGIVDPVHLVVSLLKQMSDCEVGEFAIKEGFFIEDEEDEQEE